MPARTASEKSLSCSHSVDFGVNKVVNIPFHKRPATYCFPGCLMVTRPRPVHEAGGLLSNWQMPGLVRNVCLSSS